MEDRITLIEHYISKQGKTIRVRMIDGQILDIEEVPIVVVNFDYRSKPSPHA